MFAEDLSNDRSFAENLLDKYAKIIGIYTNEIELFKAINENIDLTLKQDLSLSFYNQHQKSTRELSKESALFLWFQLFKDVLLHLPQNDKNAKQQLVNYLKQCYHNNNKQLKLIDEFDSLYKAEDAIKWYTGQPFLYKNLNKALRTEDIEQLYLFRFFITDLCTVLHEEYTYLKEFEPCITLYRGASMSNDELRRKFIASKLIQYSKSCFRTDIDALRIVCRRWVVFTKESNLTTRQWNVSRMP
ncbi:unnamed protein product [Adineta ricciae]|uniref:Uncharacterized protein n=1 Tax=Adineta ricciae TaxID=249248 RepID=A0A815GWH0_ADIRI|nr:unnamed protein product [Adineta ricciae]